MIDTIVIKHGGKRPSEKFDITKLRNSILSICLCNRKTDGESETIAERVTKVVMKWAETKNEITTRDIRIVVYNELKKYSPDTAYLYKQHRAII
jgi:phenylpyruvate tautomerase PptA (4-oxalocrotonate tautomerase family)